MEMRFTEYESINFTHFQTLILPNTYIWGMKSLLIQMNGNEDRF